MAHGRIYTVRLDATSVTGAITLVQLLAGSNQILEILRAWVGQSSSTTSAQQTVGLVRKSGAATVTTFTPVKHDPDDAASGVTVSTTGTGVNASGEGTDTEYTIRDAFNVLTGWLYVPTPEERPVVKGAGIFGLKLPVAPGSAITVTAGITYREIG